MNFSLWPACVKTHTFSDQLAAAANAGFSHLPIGLTTYRALIGSGLSANDIVAMAADQGIALGHYDGFSAWAPIPFNDDLPDAAKAVFDISAEGCLEICQQLGLTAICATGTFNPGQFEQTQLADCFGQICQQADAMGIRVDLEFLPMWGVATLDDAWSIVNGSQASNAGILMDTWHFLKGTPNFELLEQLPDGVITTVQLADAMKTQLGDSQFEDTLRFRELPGDGELELMRVLTILRQKNGIVDIGPEIFSDKLDQLSATEAAQQACQATRDILRLAGFGSRGFGGFGDLS